MIRIKLSRGYKCSAPAFERHFEWCLVHYGPLLCVNLLGTRNQEQMLSTAYQEHFQRLSSVSPWVCIVSPSSPCHQHASHLSHLSPITHLACHTLHISPVTLTTHHTSHPSPITHSSILYLTHHTSHPSPITHLIHHSSHPSHISPITHLIHHLSHISSITHLTHHSSHPSHISPITHLTHHTTHVSPPSPGLLCRDGVFRLPSYLQG